MSENQNDEIIADLTKRRTVLATAVAVCMNDHHLTDLATIKRAWFFSETGRDEPVGNLPWDELRVMARESPAATPPNPQPEPEGD